ncbi:MAG: DUF2065 domain-containing protein [Alphaproteobacteria bacterium]|nr:DUF2065 domain-containing protein [Alphaproteobacteria bacterium]
MTDFIVAIALILAIEGAIYALFPDGMKRVMIRVLDEPSSTLRTAGILAAFVGVAIVWMIRG